MITSHLAAAAKPASFALPSALPHWMGWVGVAMIVLIFLSARRGTA